MTGSINKVVLLGNLGRDPEIRHSNSGKKIATFSIATSDTWKDSSNTRQERTEWHRIVVFNSSIADFVERFVKKGSKVYVEGSLQSRKWTDKDGQERFVTEIVVGQYKGELLLLDPRAEGAEGGAAASSNNGWDSTPDAEPPADTFADEIPF